MKAKTWDEADLVPYAAARRVCAGPALVLAPHPDDEVLGCGGAILRHLAAGDDVHIVVATDGGAGEQDRAAYVRTRRIESENAARVLGCRSAPEFWELDDRSLEYGEELIGRIGTAIEQTGAAVVYAPCPEELHPDHNALGLCALEAVRRAKREMRLAMYEVSAPLRPNLLLDITDVVERKREAVRCFVSQLRRNAYDELITALNRYRAYTLPSEVRAAEAYRVFTRGELREDPLQGFVQPVTSSESRSRRGSFGSPLISVIVRTTGRESLGEALASVSAQTWPNVEMVLVDAKGGLGWGRGRNILPRASRFPVRNVGTGQSLGRSQAANLGIEAAEGAFVLFLDDDDWLYPHHLARLHDALAAYRYADAAYAGVDMVEARADGSKRQVSEYNDPWDPARLLCENYIPIHAVLFRRTLVTEGGCRFDEALPVFEDWDFWIQLSRRTSFIHVPEAGAAYRLPGGSPIHDRTSDATGQALEMVRAKWSRQWTQTELARLWTAARSELSPNQRQLRENELARLRAESEGARRALVACEAALREAERRSAKATSQVRQLEAALAEMSASSAVTAARLLRSVSPRLHKAVGWLGRRLVGVDIARSDRDAAGPLPELSRLGILRSCPDSCGREDRPGLAIDRAELVDYSERESTPDQKEIEDALEQRPIEGRRILHAGIGNSALAQRFAGRASAIEGLTVSPAELAHACGLGIASYRPQLLSKYDPRAAAVGGCHFDYVVDNNLASFACCKQHFCVMFQNYASLLRPGGELLTHKLGMDWTVSGDSGWQLSDADLEHLAGIFGFGKPVASGGVRSLRRK